MSRTLLIASLLAAASALAAVSTAILAQNTASPNSGMSAEQRATREKFFGSGKPLPPIEKGQEMRPRW